MIVSQPLVSVIVVHFNGVSIIRDCLDSVYAQPYRPIEVIVVDNHSTDGSQEFIRTRYREVRLLENAENMGFAAGNNIGVAAARGEFVVLLNDDTVVGEAWLPGLLEALQQPSVGAVTSKVITDGVPSAFYEMNGTINYLGYNIMRAFSDLSQIFFAGGASLAYRRTENAAPFPEYYFLYHEDVYLSWRLRLAGRSIRMAQDSVVSHRGSETARRHPSADVTFYQHRNRILNCLLFFELGTLLKLLPYFAADALASLAAGAAGKWKSFPGVVRAYWWLLTHGRLIASERNAVQRARVVPDRSIMTLMSAKVLDGDGGLAKASNAVSRAYARLVGLRYHG